MQCFAETTPCVKEDFGLPRLVMMVVFFIRRDDILVMFLLVLALKRQLPYEGVFMAGG